MRNIWNKCAYILILQFVLVSVALSNTLTVDEVGNVLAETDRYRVRFEHGVLVHFHNKLTDETYTQGKSEAITRLILRKGGIEITADTAPEIKRGPSPLECELIYRNDEAILHLFIGIDVETGDLLIRQKGFSKTVGIEHIIWGFANLSNAIVDVIAPVEEGETITQFDRYVCEYPGHWEAQLAILQGERGGGCP